MLTRPVLYILIVIGFTTACSDAAINPSPSPKQAQAQKQVPQKITGHTPVFLHEFESEGILIKPIYNDLGQLLKISLSKQSDNGKGRDSSVAKLIYKEGRLFEVQTQWRIGSEVITEHTIPEYDNKGKIIKCVNDFRGSTHEFKYNEKGKLVGIINREGFRDEWDYDINGNVIKKGFVKPHPAKDPKGDNHFTGTFKYDDYTNPFSHNSLGELLYTLGFAVASHYQFLSQNNPVEIVDEKTYVSRNPLPDYKSSGTKTTISYKNKYDENNLLTEVVEETLIQAFTNEKPDPYNKDRVIVKPSAKFVCSLKKR